MNLVKVFGERIVLLLWRQKQNTNFLQITFFKERKNMAVANNLPTIHKL